MDLSFNVDKPVEVVFDYLSDMQKFVSVHPVIYKIDRIAGNNYLVHERLQFAFIPISFTYKVTVDQDFDQKKVSIKAIVMKLTTIYMNYSLTAVENRTLVQENLLFKSSLPIKSTMERIFRKQHALLFRNIEAAKTELR